LVNEIAHKYTGKYEKGDELMIGEPLGVGFAAVVNNVWKKVDETNFKIVAVVKGYFDEIMQNEQLQQHIRDGIKMEKSMDRINVLNDAPSSNTAYASVNFKEPPTFTKEKKIPSQTQLLMERYGYAIDRALENQDDSQKVDEKLLEKLGWILLYEIVVQGLKSLHVDKKLAHLDVAVRNILTAIPSAETQEGLPIIFYLTDFGTLRGIEDVEAKKDIEGLRYIMWDLSEALYVALLFMYKQKTIKWNLIKPSKDEKMFFSKTRGGFCGGTSEYPALSWLSNESGSLCNELLDTLYDPKSKEVFQTPGKQPEWPNKPANMKYMPRFDSANAIHDVWEAKIKAMIISLFREEYKKLGEGTIPPHLKRMRSEQKVLDTAQKEEVDNDDAIFAFAMSPQSKAKLWKEYIKRTVDPRNLYSDVSLTGPEE
jgi:hypothetical protein